MPGKETKSPKVKHSEGRPKRGAVRTHARKPMELLSNSGLLDELAQPREDHGENLKKVTELLLWQLGIKVAAMAKAQAWQSGALAPTCDYVKSLVTGNGSKPVELGSLCAAPIERIFAQLCAKLIVGNDVLPGQQQDWYQPTLAKVKGPSAKNPWVHMPSAPSHLTLVMAS